MPIGDAARASSPMTVQGGRMAVEGAAVVAPSPDFRQWFGKFMKVAAKARRPETKLGLIFSGFAAHRGPTHQRALQETQNVFVAPTLERHDKYGDSDMRERTIPWTPEEDEVGRRLLEADAGAAEFLEKLGRTREVARKHFYYVEHRAMVLRRRGEVPVRRGPTRQVTIAGAPNMARMDDAQKQLGAPRSLTSEFFGDPPPGRSALDRK